MALSIVKTDSRGAYRVIAKEDLYLDESQTKIIVVKQGEEVPKEAAFVLAGRGGTIPTRYADMVKAFDAPVEVKNEVKDVQVEPEPKPAAPEPDAKVKVKAEPAKPKPSTISSTTVEEKPAQ